MTYTRAIGVACNTVIRFDCPRPGPFAHPSNVLTFIGLLINGVAAVLLAAGMFAPSALVMIGAGIFDMVDGRVAARNQPGDACSGPSSIPWWTATRTWSC